MPGEEIDKLSPKEFYGKYGNPEAEPVVRVDKKPETSPSVPKSVYTPAWLGKAAEEVTVAESKLILSDFGTAFSPANEIRLHSFTPRKTRPPETRFDSTTPLSYASDIWSLGCILWEIVGVRPFLDVFLPELDDVTANQIDALGPLPDEWWDAWDGRWKRFVANGQPTEGRQPWTFDRRFEDAIQAPRRRRKLEIMDARESRAFCDMIKDILKFRPSERPHAEDILQSQWITEWAMADVRKTWHFTNPI
jgi:serine/threonine-protein kinase SRPK3